MNKCPECSTDDSFNSDGYCRECGYFRDTNEPKTIEPFHLNGSWPKYTWFQLRRLEVARNELANQLPKVQS